MSSRKRRSNRLSVEELEANREEQVSKVTQLTIMIGYGQESIPWELAAYRSVSLRIALSMVASGEAEQLIEKTENGDVVLFRELRPVKEARYTLPTMPNAASADALAQNTPGAKMTPSDRRRVDHIVAFPFIADTKAPLVMPRVSDRDREAFHRLAGTRPATAGHCYRETRVWRPETLSLAA